MNKNLTALALFSGGMDSLLAVLHMQSLGYKVILLYFETPFFPSKFARKIAKEHNLELKVFDIIDDYLPILKKPKYGFGKNANPCIHCHALMFKLAYDKLKEYKADFLISGEVLGQRPMSQNKNSLQIVAKTYNLDDFIIRPLCQKLLPDNALIKNGIVDKNEMLDFQGRSREQQQILAEKFKISKFYSAKAGCFLTDKGYALKVKDLLNYNMLERRFISLLNIGRHFRIDANTKLILGKSEIENEIIFKQAEMDNLLLKAEGIPCGLGLIHSKAEISLEIISKAASILLSYCPKAKAEEQISFAPKKDFETNNKNTLIAKKYSSEEVNIYRINF